MSNSPLKKANPKPAQEVLVETARALEDFIDDEVVPDIKVGYRENLPGVQIQGVFQRWLFKIDVFIRRLKNVRGGQPIQKELTRVRKTLTNQQNSIPKAEPRSRKQYWGQVEQAFTVLDQLAVDVEVRPEQYIAQAPEAKLDIKPKTRPARTPPPEISTSRQRLRQDQPAFSGSGRTPQPPGPIDPDSFPDRDDPMEVLFRISDIAMELVGKTQKLSDPKGDIQTIIFILSNLFKHIETLQGPIDDLSSFAARKMRAEVEGYELSDRSQKQFLGVIEIFEKNLEDLIEAKDSIPDTDRSARWLFLSKSQSEEIAHIANSLNIAIGFLQDIDKDTDEKAMLGNLQAARTIISTLTPNIDSMIDDVNHLLEHVKIVSGILKHIADGVLEPNSDVAQWFLPQIHEKQTDQQLRTLVFQYYINEDTKDDLNLSDFLMVHYFNKSIRYPAKMFFW